MGGDKIVQGTSSSRAVINKAAIAYNTTNVAIDATEDQHDTADGPSSQRITGAVMETGEPGRGRP
jgi:hypothetical protein